MQKKANRIPKEKENMLMVAPALSMLVILLSFIPLASAQNDAATQSLLESLHINKEARITSPFGPREAPTPGASTNHRGIDIAVAEGTSITPLMGGIVSHVGESNDYGKNIIITHDDGTQTRYAHLSEIIVGKDQNIVNGQGIGRTGSTGISTGQHLHIEIIPTASNNVPTDPISWYTTNVYQPSHCFLPTTPITLPDGSTQRIQSIRSGDAILSYEMDSGKMVRARVRQLCSRLANQYFIINNDMKVTGEHWVYAKREP